MGTGVRVAAAVLAGLIASIVLAYAATAVIVLTTIGIPLGAESRPLTPMQATLMLVAAAGSAFLGGRFAKRLAGSSRFGPVALSVLLFGLMLWGFSGRNSWPRWWGLAAGLAMAVGAWSGSRTVRAR